MEGFAYEANAERVTNKKLPPVPDLAEHALDLAQLVASCSYLPDPDTVKALPHALFPTIRNRNKRGTPILLNGAPCGIYDDNTSPRWALHWTHGLPTSGKTGWNIGHVWPSDMTSYTRLANLIMIPEALSRLTDKDYVLSKYLRWHAWSVYGWKPEEARAPEMPKDFAAVEWRYLEGIPNPKAHFEMCTAKCKDKRMLALRNLPMSSE